MGMVHRFGGIPLFSSMAASRFGEGGLHWLVVALQFIPFSENLFNDSNTAK